MNIGIAVGVVIIKAILLGLLLVSLLLVMFLGFGWNTISAFVSFLIQNWIIQTLIGAWVALTIQKAVAAANRAADKLRTSYERKTESIKYLVLLIDKRVYATRNYIDALNDTPNSFTEERQAYKKSVEAWNTETKQLQISILLDFAPHFGLTLDNYYYPTFSHIDRIIRRQRIKIESGGKLDNTVKNEIRRNLDEINVITIRLMREMMKRAFEDRDILDRRVKLIRSNLPLISYSQLLKAIFKPS